MSRDAKHRMRVDQTHTDVCDAALPEISVTHPAISKSVEMLAQSLPAATQPLKIIPRVRKCCLVYFKNRFSANEPEYAVDVLEADSPEIGPQIQDEVKARQNTSVHRKRVKQDKVTAANDKAAKENGAPSSSMPAPAPPEDHFHFRNSEKRIVLRIRIQSPALLRILSSIVTFGEEVWTAKPRTFIRPFSPLIYHHNAVLERLAMLQERWGSHENLGAGTPSSPALSEQDGPTARIDDCPAALQDLRAYVKFMKEEVLTFYAKFDHLHADDGKPPAKVRFQDLWYLFRVGELVFRQVGTGAERDLHNFAALGNRTWRCYGIRPPWAKFRISPSEHQSYIGEDDSERSSFGLHCYYIDYTGEEFCVVTQTFEIPPFKGERLIKSLRVFPTRFAANNKGLMADAMKISQKFLESTKLQHAAYQGWTTTVTPTGSPGTDEKGNPLNRPEYIDSEVIVDFVEAFQTCPTWKPEVTVIKPVEYNPQHVDDDFSICWWSDANRTKLVREKNEIIVLRSGISVFERNSNLNPENESADKFLVKVWENDRNGKTTTEKDLTEMDLLLLPSRIFAYVLRDRKFVQLFVQRLQPLQASGDAFKSLHINRDHKDMIQSLVDEHFRRKSSDRDGGIDFDSIDVIRGKGKGLFILLHGVPGVGKTATAEAIAAASGKPLFPITCGDLGLTPTEVESALLRIFRLADTWNCVLLLDEVDTFFSQRAKGDATLAKNALVSVFLRVLEYYDGLLFLTTNRPGALDEAFKSRIHLKLWYPHLTRTQTRDIWTMNLERLDKIETERHRRDPHVKPLRIAKRKIMQFAGKLFETLKKEKRAPWNGRQIRNSFQVASSLAHFDSRRTGKDPRLTVKHFRTIQIVTDDFDQFMHETIGKTDIEQSYERGERADHFVSKHAEDDSDESSDGDGGERGGVGSRRESLEEPYVTAPSPMASHGGGESSRRYQGGLFEDKARRSVSPNVAATSAGTRGRPGGRGGIFGSCGSGDRRPGHGPLLGLRQTPAMATSDGNEGYLSPDLARASGGRDWGMAGSGSGSRSRSGTKRGRERSMEDKRRSKRPKSNSNDEDEDDDDDDDDED